MSITTRRHWLARHPLASFFGLAFTLSWLVEVPLALQAHGVLGVQLPFALHYLAGFGPLLAAVIVSLAGGGRRGLAGLLGQLGRWRVGLGWWLVAISPLIALVLVSVVLSIADGKVSGHHRARRHRLLPVARLRGAAVLDCHVRCRRGDRLAGFRPAATATGT